MILKTSRFITSLDVLKPFEGQGLPEIAMVGKSNVGKSSLINRLTNNSKLARTSSAPGKTRLINMYLLNEAFFFADLPGYGFAKAPKDERKNWASMIEGYLAGSENLRHAMLLVDIRHDPTADDVMMAGYLRHYNIPFTVIATKADKISGAKRGAAVMAISRALQAQPWEILPFSALSGAGGEAILDLLDTATANPT